MKSFQEYIIEVEILKDYRHKEDPVKVTDKVMPKGTKIGETSSGHHIYRASSNENQHGGPVHYSAYNPKTQLVDVHLSGFEKQHKNGSATINDLSLSGREGSTLKAHELYHHLITKHNKILDANLQSEGGRKTWVGLSKNKDVHIHGWHDNHRRYDSRGNPRPEDGHATRADPSKKLLYYGDSFLTPKSKYKTNTRLIAHKADPDPTD